jgi:hypothetical protein
VCAQRILTLDAMPTEEQKGLVEPSARIVSSKDGVEYATNYWSLTEGKSCAVTLPRRRVVGESEFSAGLGSSSA